MARPYCYQMIVIYDIVCYGRCLLISTWNNSTTQELAYWRGRLHYGRHHCWRLSAPSCLAVRARCFQMVGVIHFQESLRIGITNDLLRADDSELMGSARRLITSSNNAQRLLLMLGLLSDTTTTPTVEAIRVKLLYRLSITPTVLVWRS